MKTGRYRDTEQCKEYHHPKLCHLVRKGEPCNKDRCRAVHLWTKEKSPPLIQQQDQIPPPIQPTPIQQAIVVPTTQQTQRTTVPQQQLITVPQAQQQTFLSPPPQVSPPDPLQELRKIVESLAHRVDSLTQSMRYPAQIVRTLA